MYVPIDVNFPDDDKLDALEDLGINPLTAAGLYVTACCIAKRLKSDGVITASKLRRYGATPDLLDALVTVGLFATDVDDTGHNTYRITAFLKHNPAASDLHDPKTLAHFRWHVKKGVIKPDCPYCTPVETAKPLVDTDGYGPQADTDTANDVGRIPCVREGDSDRDSDIEVVVVSPSGRDAEPDPATTDDDDVKSPDLDRLAQAVAQARSTRLGGGHRAGWIRTVANDLDLTRLTELVASGITDPTELDLALDDHAATDPDPTPPRHPAIAANDTLDCPRCDGTGWTETTTGAVTPCLHDTQPALTAP